MCIRDRTTEALLLDIMDVDYKGLHESNSEDLIKRRIDIKFHENGKGLARGDINSDGFVDLIATNSNGYIFDENGNGIMKGGPVFLWINQENENVIADAVYALSFYNEYSNVDLIAKLIYNSSSLVRNRIAVALGEMPKTSGTFALKDLLNDVEPNVRWNAAISLAKHGDSSGKNEILNLLDRNYLNKFESIDRYEKEQVLMIAVKISPLLNDQDIDKAVLSISQKDDCLLYTSDAADE